MRVAWLLTVLTLAAAAALAGQSRVRTDVDVALVTVGDRITMTVTVEHPSASQAVWPDSVTLAPFEVLDVSALPVEVTDDAARSTAVLTLTAFELGELEIPAFDVQIVSGDGIVEALSTERFGVEVVSVGTDETGDIRGIRGPLGIPLGALRLLLWVLLPLILAGLLYGLVRWMRPRKDDGPRPALGPPARPADEVALEALAALEASPLLEQGQVKEYHIIVSDILRTYVEHRFRVDALEMTTVEVLDGLKRVGVGESFTAGLGRFLEQCDLVKFAKAKPGPDESRAILELGRGLVEDSALHTAPAEAA